jgi:hypothetical protein
MELLCARGGGGITWLYEIYSSALSFCIVPFAFDTHPCNDKGEREENREIINSNNNNKKKQKKNKRW